MSELEHRPLGRSGLVVSAVGLGCNNLGREGTSTQTAEGAASVVHAAIDAGVTLFDTADIYGSERGLSERLLGRALAGGLRDDVVVATKFGMDMGGAAGADHGVRASRRYVRRAVEDSLTRLGTDRIDLYQLHRPDPVTPIEETLDVLGDLVTEGKVLYLGHSNLAGWQIADADWTARTHGQVPFVSAQNEYSLLERSAEEEVLPAVRRYGLGFLPYFPLYNGLLTGRFTREGGPADSRIMRSRRHLADDAPWDVLEEYRAFCDERGIGMLDATFGWLLAKPALSSVIAGASRPEQIVDNVRAATAWSPTADDVARLDELFAPEAVRAG